MNQLIHTSPTLVLHQLGWGIPHAMWRNHTYAFYLNSITNSNGNKKSSLAWTMSMKNSNDTMGNRTRDLPTSSAVPQPIALPRAPLLESNSLNDILGWKIIRIGIIQNETRFVMQFCWWWFTTPGMSCFRHQSSRHHTTRLESLTRGWLSTKTFCHPLV